MAANPHQKHPNGPATDYATVTPHDSNDLGQPCRALWIGAAGDVTAVTLSGAAVQFKGLSAGQLLPVIARRVNATGTTATSLVALY